MGSEIEMSRLMMINDNGVTRPMTEEEIKEMEHLTASISPPESDPNEQRMNEIEAALIELAAMLAGGGA